MTTTRITIISLLLLTVLSSKAQKNSYLIGISGSAAIGKLYGNSILKTHNYTPGFSGGFTFELKMKQNFSFYTALQFDRKGDAFKTSAFSPGPNPVGGTTYHSRLSYLTIPIMLRKTFGKNSKYFINAGPYASYRLNYTEIAENSLGRYKYKATASYLNSFDWGINAGAGIHFTLINNYHMSIELRESLGLLNLSSLPVINNGSIKTNFIQLVMGLSILKTPKSITPAGF